MCQIWSKGGPLRLCGSNALLKSHISCPNLLLIHPQPFHTHSQEMQLAKTSCRATAFSGRRVAKATNGSRVVMRAGNW